MDYDAIIVGAGPAGSITAATVAQAGFKVLLLEKNSTCRSPCAGYISNTINLELPGDSVVQSRITKMRTYFPDASFHDFALNGFVVNRARFDRSLAIEAENAGAELKWDSPLVELISGDVKFRGGEAYGKIIVGADGVFSKTASLIGQKNQEIALCAQYHIKGMLPVHNTCEIFFNSDYAPGGYAWIYPTGADSSKVGVGVKGGKKSPRQYLDAFIRESPASERLCGIKTEYVTGAIPVGGLGEKLCHGNILLVGDSAGMADPMTGAGINNAMLAGRTAGDTIIRALESEDLKILSEYEKRIKRLLGRSLDRALEKRKKFEGCSANRLLQEHLPELWVAFKQYRV